MKNKICIPTSTRELFELTRNEPRVSYIAGGTDWVVANNKRPEDGACAVFLDAIQELRGITLKDEMILIGACETMASIAGNELVQEYCQALYDAASAMGSVQIRNRATIGGNIANASPAADMLPSLAALSASAVLTGPAGQRRILAQELVSGVNINSLLSKELIVRFEIPVDATLCSVFVKVGSRREVTISRLNLAVSAQNSCGRAAGVRLFAGTLGIGALPMKEAAAILEGRSLDKIPEAFFHALSAEVDRTIPGRYSLLYKRTAITALGEDALRLLNSRMGNMSQ